MEILETPEFDIHDIIVRFHPETKLKPPPYFDDLHVVREVFEENIYSFPEDCCRIAARIASRVHPDLKEFAGGCCLTVYNDHSWIRDEKRGYDIDLTLDQFNKELEGVVFMNYPNTILRPLEEETIYQRDRTFNCKYYNEEELIKLFKERSDK